MLNPRSFSEILEEHYTPEDSSVHEFSAGWESHLEAFGLSQIIQMMSENAPASTYKVGVQKAYPVKNRPVVRIIRPSHQLNEMQISALKILQSHFPKLADNFNLQELKSAYRQAVLKTHPDQGGSSESFQEVKKSYHILLALLPGLG